MDAIGRIIFFMDWLWHEHETHGLNRARSSWRRIGGSTRREYRVSVRVPRRSPSIVEVPRPSEDG